MKAMATGMTRLMSAPVCGTSARARCRPAAVDRFCRIRRDVDDGAVMVRVVAVLIARVLGHELDHLEHTSRAVDVRDWHVGFEHGRRPFRVRKESISEHGSDGWVLNGGRHQPWTTLGVA